jgi:hypothetical protein
VERWFPLLSYKLRKKPFPALAYDPQQPQIVMDRTNDDANPNAWHKSMAGSSADEEEEAYSAGALTADSC